MVADANIVLSALIGGRAKLAILHPRGPRCFSPEAVRLEVLKHLPHLARRRGLDLATLMVALDAMPLVWMAESNYAHEAAEAQRRMAERDPDDWPVVALALALDLPIWSQDRDLTVAGIPIYTTGQVLDALREAEI